MKQQTTNTQKLTANAAVLHQTETPTKKNQAEVGINTIDALQPLRKEKKQNRKG